MTPAGEKVNATNFDFFNYAGINRPVKLYTTPQDFIADLTVTADVDFESGSAVLHYAITALGEGEGRIAVYDEAGSLVGQGEGKTGDVTIENVRLWQPMDAYLYEVRAYFGMDEYILPTASGRSGWTGPGSSSTSAPSISKATASMRTPIRTAAASTRR